MRGRPAVGRNPAYSGATAADFHRLPQLSRYGYWRPESKVQELKAQRTADNVASKRTVVNVGAARRGDTLLIAILALLVDAKEPECSARYYPQDTLAYAWVTVVPVDEQLSDMQVVWERFNEYPAFRDLIDQLKTESTEETGVDFEAEIAARFILYLTQQV